MTPLTAPLVGLTLATCRPCDTNDLAAQTAIRLSNIEKTEGTSYRISIRGGFAEADLSLEVA